MKAWLMNVWEELRASFWFIPAIMTILAVGLSLGTLHLDRVTAGENWVATLGWTFTRGPEGSRAVLSTIAGSMMTTTSVAFSITIVALQLASSQFGPRLLRNFMRDRVSQVALGTFIATFAYCLLALRAVNGTEEQRFVPHVSVTVGLALAMASLGMLIYFIHHSAASIQADNVIAAVMRELLLAIDRLFPDCGSGPGSGAVEPPEMTGFDGESASIRATSGGYIQVIDVERLMGIAAGSDLVVRVVQRPGTFVIRGGELARVWPGLRADDATREGIAGCFYLGHQRSLSQDVEFAIDQLVEVALRALSPGVNDPFTAIACVDRLGEALCRLAERGSPSPRLHDERGQLRLIAENSTVGGIFDAAFHQIRQASRGQVAVTLRLLETLSEIASRAHDARFLDAVLRHAELVHRGGEGAISEPQDRADADERYRRLLRAAGVDAGARA